MAKFELPVVKSVDIDIDLTKFSRCEYETAHYHDRYTNELRQMQTLVDRDTRFRKEWLTGLFGSVVSKIAEIDRELIDNEESQIDTIRVCNNRMTCGSASNGSFDSFIWKDYKKGSTFTFLAKTLERHYSGQMRHVLDYLSSHSASGIVFYCYNEKHNSYVGKYQIRLKNKKLGEGINYIMHDNDISKERVMPASAVVAIEKEKETKTMKFNGFKDLFICKETSNIGMSLMNGKLAVIDVKNGIAVQCESVSEGDAAIVEVPADFVMSIPAFIISTQLSALALGDVVETKQGLGFITELNPETSEIVAVLLTGETVVYTIPRNMMLGGLFQTVPKVMMPFDNMMGGTDGAMGGMMNNPMMLMMMMKDGDSDLFGDGDMMKTMMMIQMFNGGGLFGAPAK